MIITIMSALLLARLHAGRGKQVLKGAAQELVANIRRTQNMAISTKKTGGNVPCGYGLYFDKSTPFNYILFADWDSDPDCDNINRVYNGPSEDVKIIQFSSSLVEIKDTSPDPLSIFFLPPDPETSVNYPSGNQEATVTLQAKGDPAVKRIKINIAGRVKVE